MQVPFFNFYAYFTHRHVPFLVLYYSLGPHGMHYPFTLSNPGLHSHVFDAVVSLFLFLLLFFKFWTTYTSFKPHEFKGSIQAPFASYLGFKHKHEPLDEEVYPVLHEHIPKSFFILWLLHSIQSVSAGPVHVLQSGWHDKHLIFKSYS